MNHLQTLHGVSYLAPNWFWFYESVAAFLSRALQVDIQVAQSEHDPLEDLYLLHNQVDLAFICGLPFIRRYREVPHLQAIAAPVMKASRYQNRPVYFSDVIVNATNTITTFADLAGKTVCYNDPGSNSGYNLLLYRLVQGGYTNDFFSKAIQSGSHQTSIRWVAEGLIDCAAIDSTVLEQELRDPPELNQLQVIEAIGPCPMPPIVVAQHLGGKLIEQLRSALLQPDAELQAVMQKAGVLQYAPVETEEYEAIAHIYDTVVQVGYEL